ncbi:hypothetical protein C8J56DRAFT_51913 [Mycena floridula]|nr:hypothetical protein C8J56DRAFT_51913 [Mycena floridula]
MILEFSRSSTISSQPSVLSTASSVVSPHRNTTPIIAGSVSAVILIIALIIGGLFISRRRQRLRNIAEFPYETSMSDIAGPTRFVPRGLSENGLSGPQLASEKQASPEQVVPGGEPTERQRFLQARAEEINRQLTESENALTNVADAPPDLMTTLMAENIRQNAEIQRLRDLISSDWALGLTDNPPPYYPYSEAATE